MSEPLHAWRGESEEPRPNLIPDEKPAGDSNHADRGTRTNGWFHRTASRPALRAVAPTRETPPPAPADDHASVSRHARPAAPSASPVPMSEEQRWLALRNGIHPLSLTWEQIEYSIAHDGDKFGEEDYWRDVEFDRAIDREPEIE